MKSPITGKEMSIGKEWRRIKFRKEEFNILFHFFRCDDTGEKFEDDSFAQLNFNQVVNQYRAKYMLPDPEKITRIREQYGLSASKMALILGLGTNSYRQYESGEIPSQSNGRLIQLAEDPLEFKRILGLSAEVDDSKKRRIIKRLEALGSQNEKALFEKSFMKYLFGNIKASSKTGFKEPDLDKFSEMVVFFTENLQPWKTKLNKLLFYSDFLFFSKTAFSISGTPYEAYPMGPVPLKFNSIYDYLAEEEIINIEYEVFPDGGVGERFFSGNDRHFNPGIFSDKELEVLEITANRFSKTSTQEIIEISHLEKAWTENKDNRSIIDYNYAFDLNI